jgi:hypothetical protein
MLSDQANLNRSQITLRSEGKDLTQTDIMRVYDKIPLIVNYLLTKTLERKNKIKKKKGYKFV